MNKRGYRTGSISIEDAKKRFHEYYNKRSQSPIARLRAKMFDMMYQKKPKFTIKCDPETGQCEKGSEKYLLEEGPRTFDIEGIDSFPEDTEFELNNKLKIPTNMRTQHSIHMGLSKEVLLPEARPWIMVFNQIFPCLANAHIQLLLEWLSPGQIW